MSKLDLNELPLAQLVPLIGDESKLGARDLEFLREMVWRRISTDLRDFIENFWYVETIGSGYAPMVLRDYQLSEVALAQTAHSHSRVREIRLKARQIGFTTIHSAASFWSAYFHPYHPWLVSSRTEDDAKATVKFRLKRPFLMLPRWVRERGPNIETETLDLIEWDNGSWIESIPASSGAGRSKAVFGVLFDESAFVENGDEVFAALDPLCYGPMYVFSTANGMGGFFHRRWLESNRHDSEWNWLSRQERPDEPWNGTFQPWYVVPERDERWYEREKRKNRDQLWVFYQENPSTPEEAFAKSGRVALPVDTMKATARPPELRLDLLEAMVLDGRDLRPPETSILGDDEEAAHELWVWETPTVEKGDDGQILRMPNYVIGCDVAEGLEHGDRTSITVLNANTLEVAATYRGHIPVEDLGDVLWWLGYWYKVALLGPERNNHGLLPLTDLARNQYPRLYRMDSIAQIKRGDRTPRYGWHTNKATKPKMVGDFRTALRAEIPILNDIRYAEEAMAFVEDGKGGYGASPGQYDDHVLSLLIAWQLAEDVGQYPVVWVPNEQGPMTWGDMIDLIFDFDEGVHPLATPIRGPAQREDRVKSWFA